MIEFACSVCFTGIDETVAKSLTFGVVTLASFIGAVLLCFGYFFLSLYRRSRRLSAKPVLRLVERP